MTRAQRLGIVGICAFAAAELLCDLAQLIWSGMPPFVRLLALVLITRLVGDFCYWRLEPRRRTWLYWDDYLAHHVFPHFLWGVPLAVAQALAVMWFVSVFWVHLLAVSALPATILYVITRYLDELAEDRGHRPGRRLEP
ncbi:MAG: hypothetical protein AB1503_07915 [Bacillota bacterium]|nr:hypothetical protein [Bacillota bacterium]